MRILLRGYITVEEQMPSDVISCLENISMREEV